MATIVKDWSFRYSSCEFAVLVLWDDHVHYEWMGPYSPERRILSYREVREGAIDRGVREIFGEATLRELHDAVAEA